MATPVFTCGFEEGVFGPHWTAGAVSPAFVTSGALSGTRSLRVNPAAQTNCNALTVDSFGVGLLIIRLRVKFVTLPSTSGFCILHLGSNTGTGVFFGASNTLAAAADNTVGVGSVTVVVGVVYFIDIKIDKRANPWTVDMQVNGVSCGQAVSSTAGSTTAEQVRIGTQQGFGTAITADILFDDILISVTEADYPIGPGFVHPFVPVADGTHNIAGAADFKRGAAGTDILNATTDSFQLIDSIPMDAIGAVPTTDDYINAIAPPNATDYTEHVFGPAPGIATPTVAPRAVEVIVETAQSATQTGSFKLALNDNGTLDTIKEQAGVAGVVNVAAARKHYAAGPAGAWVIGGGGNGDFTDLRIRFSSADAAPDQYFVNALIEAEFDGPLLTKQTLNIGTDMIVGEDLVASPPTSYEVSDSITATVSSVVTVTVFNETTEGETPQQQCAIETNGGEDAGTTIVNPGQHVFVRVQVSGADTDVGLSGVSNP